MKHTLLFALALIIVQTVGAQEYIKYGPDYIVIEAEDTPSDMSKWTLRKPGDAKYYKGEGQEAINQTYLEYTGPWLGGADTELTYKFTCPKTSEYRLVMRMYQPLNETEAGDKKNDVFVKLAGNFTSATNQPKSELEKKHKFWGRGVRKWGSCHKLEVGGAHFDLRYGLIEGEEYTFVMSGRSGGTSIDYILLYNDVPRNPVNIHDDIATKFSADYHPNSPLVAPTGISLAPEQPTVREGSTAQLSIVWEPENAQKDVAWSSSDEAIMTVDETGMLTAKGNVGQTATITAKSTINELTASIEVTIVEFVAIEVTSISISPQDIFIPEAISTTLQAQIMPENADDKSVTWSSSHPDIATVDQNGVVTAVSLGETTIKATSNTNTSISGETKVSVGEYIAPFLKFDDDTKYLTTEYEVGGKLDVSFEFHAGTGNTLQNPIKVFLRHIHIDNGAWTIANDKVMELSSYVGSVTESVTASISLEGVTPTASLPEGDFYYLFVKCWYSSGETADIGLQPINIVERNIAVASISLNQTEVTLKNIGDTHQLLSTVMPENATNQEVTWSTSNAAIVEVDDNGLITAVAEGNAKITATTTDGGKTAEANVTISIEQPSPLLLSEKKGFTIWPNPALESFHLDFDKDIIGAYLELYNTAGKLIYAQTITALDNEISLKGFTPGIYLIKLNNGIKMFTDKLIVR
ncbi:MAG: Ig-like domain-containing protein [Cyclobacteriaceae bacterium]